MAVKKSTNSTQRSKATVKARTAPKKRSSAVKSNKPSFFQSLFLGKRKWAVLGIFLVLFGAVGTYMLRPSKADTVVLCSTVKYGSSGNCVRYLQRMINGTNVQRYSERTTYAYYGAYLSVDGSFGPNTLSAVKAFQNSTSGDNALTVDGIVGPKTWGYLCWRVKTYYDGGSTKYAGYPYRTDAYNAGKSAGCQGDGWPKITTTTTTSVSSIQANARTILNSGATFSQSAYRQQIKFYADTGQPGKVSGGNDTLCYIHPAVMQGTAYAAQRYKLYISSINRYCMGSLTTVPCTSTSTSMHCKGRAIDVAAVNGVASTGRNSNDQKYITSFFAGVSSSYSYALGQRQCGSTPSSLFSGKSVRVFEDTCNHVHIHID